MNNQAETEIRKAVSRVVNQKPFYWTIWNLLKNNLKEGGAIAIMDNWLDRC